MVSSEVSDSDFETKKFCIRILRKYYLVSAPIPYAGDRKRENDAWPWKFAVVIWSERFEKAKVNNKRHISDQAKSELLNLARKIIFENTEWVKYTLGRLVIVW